MSTLSASRLSLAGLAALAVALGVGRFAFTPMLPLMQAASGLTLVQGGWLAGANYLGYLAGALTAGRLPWRASRQLMTGLAAVVLTTALMSVSSAFGQWMVWRFAAGVASAWVLVSTSMLCLDRLAALGQPQRAGLVFAGVGCGIGVAGLMCLWLSLHAASPTQAWWSLAGAAGLGSVVAWPLVRVDQSPAVATGPVAPTAASGSTRMPSHARLIVCYGLLGLGYILPATFLPAQARLLVNDPGLFGWAWPVFGAAAAVSTLLASAAARFISRRHLWAASQLVMAVGVLLPLLWPGLAAIIVAAVCVGGTFMVVTMIGMQEARVVGGTHARRLIAAFAAAFATGQLAGPLLVSLGSLVAGTRLDLPLVLAAVGLMLSSLMLLTDPSHKEQKES